MSGRRGVTILGLGVAGAAGYYLYNAGGDPKAAEKHLEADAHKASAKIRGEFSDRDGQAAAKAEQVGDRGQAYLNQAESKLNSTASEAQKKWEQGKKDAEKKYEQGKQDASNFAQKAGTEINKGIDKFDKTVEDKAAQAKSGISSWFGGK